MIINQTNRIQIPEIKIKSLSGADLTVFGPDKNPNIYSVVHESIYRYDNPVEESKHLFRLQPVHDLYQTVLDYRLTISSNGKVSNFTGVFNNHATFVDITEPYRELKITSESIVAISDYPRDSLDSAHQLRILPAVWMPWDLMMMEAYLMPPELPEAQLFELAQYAMSFVKKNKNDLIAVLNDINMAIYSDFTYLPGSTTFSTTPYDVYVHREGVCQDFAQLFICLARLLNLPARYRVGYIYTGGEYENQLQSEASHAWAEVYIPYFGWYGFDPTNGCVVEKNHIRVACGRHYNDATPTSGTIFKGGGEGTLDISVQVKRLNQSV